MKCPFCDPTVLERETVLANEYCIFLQQPQVILPGSGLIIPRRHCATPFELTPQEWHASFALLHDVKRHLDELHHPDGYNLGWNVGAIAGQEVFHVHLHIIPRFADEPYAGKGIRYWLKQPSNKRP